MRRRDLLAGVLSLPIVMGMTREFGTASAVTDPAHPFGPGTVKRLARELSAKPWAAPKDTLSPALAKLGYDGYRTLRYRPDRALWAGERLPFQAQFFHRGFLYKDRVEMYEVAGGEARRIPYAADLFDLSKVGKVGDGDLGFAGFRIHAPMNRPDYYDEVCAFLGASYFRAVAKNHIYGLSARGLAIGTAESGGEEFPQFTTFWLERPTPESGSLVVHALLDSRSTTGAFRFVVRPGEATIFDVEMTLYPRVAIARVGIAPLTSMFLFAANDRASIDDYRPAVHDSEGLSLWTGGGEQIWRPLANPAELQVSAFADTDPRGFGLMQRQRDFGGYKDLEARYDRRPSLWIETIGKWGKGAVHLVEIPTDREIHDNIVAFWRPEAPLAAGQEHSLAYRMHWCWEAPWKSDLAVVTDTRVGLSLTSQARLFVLEVIGDRLRREAPARRAAVTAEGGKLANIVAQPNPVTGGWRISFELEPERGRAVELRVQLLDGDQPASEVWLYRWTP
ncbi:glucans biosynthesis protein G [Allostella sp. ATCC 35155]|nr:glucans biosynthesis protein G [Stella sp. ATCC 35155]